MLNDHPQEKLSCLESELLISKACDRECSPEELRRLKDHLRICSHCRNLMREYLAISDMMTLHLANACCPLPKPVLPKQANILSMHTLREYAAYMAMIAASILFFVFGHHMGFVHAQRQNTTENAALVSVATPSMWAANRPHSQVVLANIESEQPFTESIKNYRAAIGEEIRRGNVDWLRIRELVEAMGELRTDLELLTIHMAYIDIRTGSSPSEVASHWETLGESTGKTVYKR